MLGNVKTISLVLAINVLVGGIYALAQNLTTDSKAVYETRMVSGYDVTGIIFDLNDTDPTLVDSVTFHIASSNGSAQANHVEIQTKAGGTWTECALIDDVPPTRVATCTFNSLAAEDVTALNIVAK